MAATAGLVLPVACANVANLLLVRGEGRQKELTVRAALGAGQGTVFSHFLAEVVPVLAVLGTVIGVALAIAGVKLPQLYGPSELPRLNEVRVDVASLAFAVIAAVVASMLATLVPALRQRRVNLGAMLREGGRSGTAGRARQRVRGALVMTQVAMALVLLSASGLLVRSVLRLRGVRPGFDAAHVLTFRVDLPSSTYAKSSDKIRFFSQLAERLSAAPGVRSVSFTGKLPLLVEGTNLNPVVREDRPTGPNELPPLAVFVRATGTYFSSMSIPLVAGRTFTGMTDAQSPFEVVISRKLATEFWGDSSGNAALGARLKMLNGSLYTVIGVAETVHDSSIAAPAPAQVYFPVVPAADTGADRDLVSFGSVSVVVRTTGDPLALAPLVRREVVALDRTLPIYNLRPMDDIVAGSFARLSFTLVVLSVAAGATLFLGAVGLYGVVAYVVSLRTREIGVRIALGAQPRTVGRLIARQGIVLAGAGAAVGLLVFAALARLLRSFLFEVSPADPLTLVGVTGLLIVVAAAASWVPARRASRIDPVEAMRTD
ncbi:MAG: FtsX-like permease family protein [Gemmatimonadaceae bacterium]